MSEEGYREYLSLLWQDIYHGRNQDWQVLLIIFTITVAEASIPANEVLLRGTILFLALTVAIFGMTISLQHWEIYMDKIELVRFCEEELGLRVLHKAIPRNRIKVSFMVPTLFGIVAAGYIAILYNMLKPTPTWWIQAIAGAPVLIFPAVIMAWRRRISHKSEKTKETLTKLRAPFRDLPPDPDAKVPAYKQKKTVTASDKWPRIIYSQNLIGLEDRNKNLDLIESGLVILPIGCKTKAFVAEPYIELDLKTVGLNEAENGGKKKAARNKNEKVAKSENLRGRLAAMGSEPLKLVVGEMRTDETMWEGLDYSGLRNGRKEVLIDENDLVEISFADDCTEQDFHRHVNLWETYVSLFEIAVKYLRFAQPSTALERKTSLPVHGRFHVLTVPPGIRHKVILGGFTLVIQQAFSNARIQDDKRIFPNVTPDNR